MNYYECEIIEWRVSVSLCPTLISSNWLEYSVHRSRGHEDAKNENERQKWKMSVSCEISFVVQGSLCGISLGKDAV